MRILIGVNILANVAAEVYGNHCQFWYRLGKDFPEIEFILYAPRRTSIDNMRNEAARQALLFECDYLMFIDDDVSLPPETFKKLLDANKDIVAMLTYIRGYPYMPMYFKREGFTENKELLIKLVDPDKVPAAGFDDCEAVGFSCALIKTSLLKKVSAPFFLTSTGQTEDVYFCLKTANELGRENVSIAVCCDQSTGHLLCPEFLTRENRNLMHKMIKDQVDAIKSGESSKRGDRSVNDILKYLEKV